MRLALTYNEQHARCEAEAEFDTPATIARLAGTLARLGHDVTPVEVGRPIEQLVATLRRLRPELVFNLAEGSHGRFREAFYPALFEQLGLRHTGSPASVLALCLDKALAKRVVAAAGVPVLEGWCARSAREAEEAIARACAAGPPLIVKPIFEGASKGITQASVVTDVRRLRNVVSRTLVRYPAGVLIERYLDGTDAAVGWVDGLGVLPPVRYVVTRARGFPILDLRAKLEPGALAVEVLDDKELAAVAARAFDALGVTGFARADFRVAPGGTRYFLEMNPLPSLAAEANELFLAAAVRGHGEGDVLSAIVSEAICGGSTEPVRVSLAGA